MRLTLSDKKEKVVNFIYLFLRSNIVNSETKIIINGEEEKGKVKDFILDEENFDFIKLVINENEYKIPFNEETKANFNRKLLYLETDSHTTLIEIKH